MASPIDIEVAAPHHEQSRDESSSKRRHKKHRYRKQGYHKSERDNSRRVEARNFLSGITLDSRLRSSLDLDLTALAPKASPNPRLNSFNQAATEECVAGGSHLHHQQLHEIAAHLFDHHSPSKSTPSKNHDHELDYNMPSLVTRSASLFDSSTATTPGNDQRRIVHSKSVGNTEDHGDVYHYSGNLGEWLLNNNNYGPRIVLVASGAPFLIMSTLGYKKDEKSSMENPQRQRVRTNSTSLQLELDVELGTSDEVSLAHLFNPVYQHQHESNNLKGHHSSAIQQSGLGASYNDVLEHPLPSSCGPSFPWAWFRDHHSSQDVLIYYHPLCIDNYEFFVGPYISTLSVQSYRVSIIQYAKASEIKKGINDQFSETFPHVKITLSKLRSIKKEMYTIAKEVDLDLAAISYSYVYFEKLVLMGKVNKSNRKVVAGVCLLLAAKFFHDIKKQEIKFLLDEILNTFRLNNEEIISQELSVLAALHFSLLTPIYQALTHHEKLVEQSR